MFPNSTNPVFSPLSLARMIWNSKPLIGLVWLFLWLLSMAVVLTIPPVYKAEAVILVDSPKIPERIVASTVNADVQDRLATITQQILATNRLQKIIDTFHLYERDRNRLPLEEIIEKMRQDTKITLEKGWTQDRPGAFRIAYQGSSPVIVAEVANQIGNLLIEENLRTRESHAAGTSEFLEDQVQQAKKTLDGLEVKVAQYKLQHQGELPEQEGAMAATLSRFQIELQGNQDATNRAEQTKASLASSLSIAESTEKILERTSAAQRTAAADKAGRMNPDDPNAPKDSVTLQTQLDLLKSRYTDNHPDVVNLKTVLAKERLNEKKAHASQTADASASSATAKAAAAAEISPEVLQQQERIAGLKSDLSLAKRELDFRNNERREILAKIAAFQGRMDKLPVREQELALLSRDYEIAKTNYKSLLDKRLAADMATDMEHRQEGERFTMIDPARPPGKPSSPDRVRWVAFGGLLSLIVALCVGFARELKKDVLLGEWELPQDVFIVGRISAL